ncbi:MAG: small-conductance mechanosensitive channel [Saprospiraceae bacterium]|jgi:small-conductance mechanosensitive channel|tara:strand:+ start:2050 stop:2547 length:498 start_codon:yes stop_codon:yes gene_type:complete
MEDYKLQLVESAVSIIILIFVSSSIQQLIEKAGVKFSYDKTRVKLVKKMMSLIIFLIFIGIFLLIWGIAPSQLAGYLASLFTVVGIAFLAQWSILSNISSTLIIFFNHQVSIGDTIEILDKDYQIEGKVSDIGIFFIIIKISSNEYVSLPSNVFMQKMVKKIKDK